MYLIRHGATAANLEHPARLQGRNDPPLDDVGVRQSELTSHALLHVRFAASYCSPLIRARHTAALIAPYLQPQPVEALIECDVGRWEGVDWDTIRRDDSEAFARYMADPATIPYPGGENFTDVRDRTKSMFEQLMTQHLGAPFLVVSHHVINRVFLALTLGLELRQARNVILDNCGISIVRRDKNEQRVVTVNSTIHLL
jgi:broad specificity phosphatase PhoE